MHKEILTKLQGITAEEQAILDGRTAIDRDIYMQGQSNTVNAQKLLSAGKLITIRPHTRFIHFPEHTHDHVEVVYMCSGQTKHIVNGKTITLEQGDLLFLGQRTTHEVCKAEEGDVAINLIVLPDFFTTTLTAIGEEQTPLRRFLVGCLCGRDTEQGYLHFHVSSIQTIQNLVENLLWTLLEETPNKRKISQMTMTLLFMQLMGRTETLLNDRQEDAAAFQVMRYVETNYVSGSFGEIAEKLHYDPSWLSREIKRKTGKTYTQLVQEKRLAQAAFLLKHTDRNVADISRAVGYENISYFHRIFTEAFGRSPRHYRVQERTLF
ncbi:MAG: helix-turn-helix domain-containing protein [Oscillospiraceae bacterium]|nr:helix-turn-helix domain-containing protein [Oscillospiraceae bacterium]